MNWPPLTGECSESIASVLKDVVHAKPKDLINQVAKMLQERSEWDPAEFEQYFEECRRKPRMFVLEDRCPEGQDPMSWVPMRYNDDTILFRLSNWAADLVADIRSPEGLGDTKDFLLRATVAYPELQYLHGSKEEVVAAQTLKAICTIWGGCWEEEPEPVEGAEDQEPPPPPCRGCPLDDEDPQLSFQCEALVANLRTMFLDAVTEDGDSSLLEAIITACLLRVVGANETFRRQFGGGASTADGAILNAIENHREVLPSLLKLPQELRELVTVTIQVMVPLDQLVSAEVVPYHMHQIKEHLVSLAEGAVNLFMFTAAVEHTVSHRSIAVTDEDLDTLRQVGAAITGMEKTTGAKGYETILKKRAERYHMRIVRDDFHMRTVVRLACLSRREGAEWWTEVQQTVENLPEAEKKVLTDELGQKDGISQTPVIMMPGLSNFVSAACSNDLVGLKCAVLLLINILKEMTRLNTASETVLKLVTLNTESLAAKTRDWRGGSVPFEATPFSITMDNPDLGQAEVSLAC